MRIVLTGGASDLAHVLAPTLVRRGDQVIRLDIRPPRGNAGTYLAGSILDRAILQDCMEGTTAVVHIAAWHGIHAVTGQRDVYDFWDLNVTGTFYVLEAAARAGVRSIVYLSSTSVDEWPDVYGHTKMLGEQITETYVARHNMRAFALRPRAFIPHWNRTVYPDFSAWARWYWPGAVHIRDVAQAVVRSLDVLAAGMPAQYAVLPIDGACPYTPAELQEWDQAGPGSTFRARFAAYEELARQHGLDPAQRPEWLAGDAAYQLIGYQPSYGHAQLLEELAQYGSAGPDDADRQN
jgi:nucleoside-diphosphate-sugar epimerase